VTIISKLWLQITTYCTRVHGRSVDEPTALVSNSTSSGSMTG